MTTILKSNAIAKKYLMSGLQLSVPSDYRAKLDFALDDYKFDGAAKQMLDVISVTRNSAAGYINANGQYSIASIDTPRMHNDPIVGKGLLVEPSFTNLLANPAAPATQTVTTSLTANNWFIVQVWGTGSCAVEIRNSSDVVQVTGTATESQPFLWLIPTAFSGAKVTVTPTNLTQMQAHQTGFPRKFQTKAASTGSVYADDVLFNKSLFANILSKQNQFSVIIKKSEIASSVTNTATSTRYANILQIAEESGTKGVFVAAKKGASKKSVLRTQLSTETFLENKDSQQEEVYALVFGANEAKMYQNGSIVTMSVSEALTLTRLYLASGSVWAGTLVGNMQQVIKEVYIYDRKLTDTELAAIVY